MIKFTKLYKTNWVNTPILFLNLNVVEIIVINI